MATGPFIRGKIRRELYHLYEHVLPKTKTARINGSRLISVLDSFPCECSPQQRQSNMAHVSKFRRHVAICRRSNILKTFLMKMAECSRRSAIALSLHNNKKSFSLAVDHVFRFAFVSVLIIHERIQKRIKLKSLRIDGNPRKRKRVEICNTFSLPVACQSALGQAKIFPPKINACVLCVRVLCKTRRSFIRSFSRLS